jgi:hypothetical protein
MGTSINTVSRCTSDGITVSSEALSHYFLLLSPCDAEDSVWGKIIIEQCEQGRNIAALERIIKAPNNFGG